MDWLKFVIEQWMLVSGLIVLGTAYFALNAQAGGKTISIHDVSRLLNADAAVLVDVRDPVEFKAGHITGAVNFAFASLAGQLDELEKFRGKTLIVADKMGQQSAEAGKLLLAKGFTVVRLSGGMSEWTAQNLPLIKSKK